MHTHAWLCAPGARAPSRTREHSPLHSAPQFFLSLCSSCAKDSEDRGRRMSCEERVAGDTRGAMTLTSTQTELVPTVGTSAVTSLSAAQQDRGCTSLTSFSEEDRSRPAPHALVVELKTSSVLLTNERAIDTSEVCSSASQLLSASIYGAPPTPHLSLIRPPPVSRQVSLGNIFPLISDAADSNAATVVRARALLTPPALAMSLSPRGRSASSRRTRYPSPRTLSTGRVSTPPRCTRIRPAAA